MRNGGGAGLTRVRQVPYEMMEAAWRQPETGAWPDSMADWMLPFARTIEGAKKYVVSGTLDRVDRNADARGTTDSRQFDGVEALYVDQNVRFRSFRST